MISWRSWVRALGSARRGRRRPPPAGRRGPRASAPRTSARTRGCQERARNGTVMNRLLTNFLRSGGAMQSWTRWPSFRPSVPPRARQATPFAGRAAHDTVPRAGADRGTARTAKGSSATRAGGQGWVPATRASARGVARTADRWTDQRGSPVRPRHGTRERTRLGNRMREQLWRYYPQFLAAVGDDIAAPWALDLWQCLPTPRAAQRVRETTLARLLESTASAESMLPRCAGSCERRPSR